MEGRQAVWECHCIQSRFFQELELFTCQTESWGMQKGCCCGGSSRALDIHQNLLYSFTKICMPTPYKIRTLGVETGGFHPLVSLLKNIAQVLKADSRVPPEIS